MLKVNCETVDPVEL